jgi:hypothetical protein
MVIDMTPPNQSPEPTAVGVCSFRFDVAVAAWLSSDRWATQPRLNLCYY